MNKNIFFLSIAAVFSAFDAIHASSAVKHEKVRGMGSIKNLRDIRDGQRLEAVIRNVEASVPELAPASSDKIEYFKRSFIGFRQGQKPGVFYNSRFAMMRKHPAKS